MLVTLDAPERIGLFAMRKFDQTCQNFIGSSAVDGLSGQVSALTGRFMFAGDPQGRSGIENHNVTRRSYLTGENVANHIRTGTRPIYDHGFLRLHFQAKAGG